MEQELKDTCNELTKALGQRDNYKEESDDLHKQANIGNRGQWIKALTRNLFFKVLACILIHEVENVIVET